MISGPLSYQVYSFEKRASGHKSHVRKLNKNGYVTIRHMFGIDHAFRFVVRLKELSGESYKLNSNLKRFLLSFGCLETSKRGFVFASLDSAWNEVLRGESTVLQSRVPDFGLCCIHCEVLEVLVVY